MVNQFARATKNMSATCAFFVLLALAFGLTGCGGPEVAIVSGTTEYDGKSIPAGTRILFQKSSTGYVAVGVVQDDGSFALKHKGAAEIEPGDYTVFVGPPESNLTEGEFMKLKAKVDADFRKRGKKPPPSPDWVLPGPYYQANTSPLSESIQPGEQTVSIKLEDE